MFNGILPVYKERGFTSHDVVFKLRKILKMKKIGHTGTLDPEVDGVLPICLGSATKVSDYIMEMGKTYQATVSIGIRTTTEDQTGDILERYVLTENDVTQKQVDGVLANFEGEITQIPPMYSAVKVNGKKLYEYARNNESVVRPERKAYISNIQRISPLRYDNDQCQFDMLVQCGKGTYIRTLATDIGAQLGYPAHMSSLTRTMSGGFTLEDALSISQIKSYVERSTLQAHLFPLEYGLKGLKHIEIRDERLKQRISNGQKLEQARFKENINEAIVFIDHSTKQALAIYIPHPEKDGEIKPKKVFN